MRLDFNGGVFKLKCNYADNALIEKLDKRWNKRERLWRVYDARINRDVLATLPITDISHDARSRLYPTAEKVETGLSIISETLPYGFQTDAIRKMLDTPTCALFAPVGSGKTKIMIDVLQTLYRFGKIDKILIIGLVSIRENWKAEIRKHWAGEPPWDKIQITGIESYSAGKLYDEMSKWVTKTTCIVVDESSKIKNMKAKRTSSVVALGEGVKYKYIMTGTPVLNGNVDLFAQFRFLDIDIIGIQTFIGFRNRYIILGGFKGKQNIGYRKQDELLENLRPYSFVINKKEAMPFLPPQTFTKREVIGNPEQKRLIKRIRTELISESKKGDVKLENVLTTMLRISQIAGGFTEDALPVTGSNPKLLALQDFIDESPDEPMVIFCRFRPEIDLLVEKLPGSVALHGGISPVDRQRLVDEFQDGKHKYLVCQYAVGAIGINLHRARITVFYSFDFSLELWQQAIGRIARMQQDKPMIYVPLILKGSGDAMVYKALQGKENVAKVISRALETKTLEDLI